MVCTIFRADILTLLICEQQCPGTGSCCRAVAEQRADGMNAAGACDIDCDSLGDSVARVWARCSEASLLKFVPTPCGAQGANQLYVKGAIQRMSVEKHDAGGAFVPACPTFDFDDAAEDATLGIAGPRIRDACLAQDQFAQFSRYRENAAVRAYAG